MTTNGNSRPTYIAIIGSGPSGFYAAEALLKQKDHPVRVDMFDRLPTPYGLVRGGVAPDHQKIKGVTVVYEKVAAMPEFRFFGHVKLGQDIQVEDLHKFYDQVVYAVGNESDKRLGIPGEDLKGNYSATEFVGWYNGHPDYRDRQFDLAQERVAVIGIGNVAMDVTRILAQDPEKLAGTDIAEHAVAALRKSKVKEIYLLGRRGPAQAAFSPVEIEEIGELESSDLVIDPKEAAVDELSQPELSDPQVKKNTDYVLKVSQRGNGQRGRKVILRFLVSPTEILGEAGHVRKMKIERNKLVKDERGAVAARGTGEIETLDVGLVFRSVGYRGIAIKGVPFDEKSGRIPNAEGRVTDAATKQVRQGEYVVGWAKRGPTGLIGTNRADSVATVKAMIEDIPKLAKSGGKDAEGILGLLKNRGVHFVTFQDWKKLDQLEVSTGKAKGKIREKFTRIPEMLSSLKQPIGS